MPSPDKSIETIPAFPLKAGQQVEDSWVKDLTTKTDEAIAVQAMSDASRELANAIPVFNDYTQSLAGNLIAQVETLQRTQADLNNQRTDAAQARDRALQKAEDDYADAIRQLDEKSANAVAANRAIDAALKQLGHDRG